MFRTANVAGRPRKSGKGWRLKSWSLLMVIAFYCSLRPSQALSQCPCSKFRKIVHQESGKCLDIAVDNNELMLFNCTGDSSQFWFYNERGSGHIESNSQPGQCITFVPDAAARLGDCEKDDSGWTHTNLMFVLRSKSFKVCLDNYMNRSADYNPLIAFSCWPDKGALAAQRWLLV